MRMHRFRADLFCRRISTRWRRPARAAPARRGLVAALTLGVLSLPAVGVAQDAADARARESQATDVRVLGRIIDHITRNGLPLARVLISQPDTELGRGIVWQGISGPGGRFEGTVAPGTYDLRVETLAYAPLLYSITVEEEQSVDLHIEMVPDALQLSPLVVTTNRSRRLELGGFFERRSSGLGTTMDRAEIEAMSPPRVSELLLGFAGVQVVRSSRGRSADVRLRRGCTPQVVLNGAPFTYPISLDDLVNVGELEAIEVYHGTTASAIGPSTSACGTIMVWTRQLGGVVGRPFEWRRLFAAAGLVTVFAILFP